MSVNADDRGITSALIQIAVDDGLPAVTTALGNLTTSGAVDAAFVALLTKGIEDNGEDGLRAGVNYARKLADDIDPREMIRERPNLPLAEASTLLAAYQSAEAADQRKLRKAALVVGRLSKPFLDALVATILAL